MRPRSPPPVCEISHRGSGRLGCSSVRRKKVKSDLFLGLLRLTDPRRDLAQNANIFSHRRDVWSRRPPKQKPNHLGSIPIRMFRWLLLPVSRMGRGRWRARHWGRVHLTLRFLFLFHLVFSFFRSFFFSRQAWQATSLRTQTRSRCWCGYTASLVGHWRSLILLFPLSFPGGVLAYHVWNPHTDRNCGRGGASLPPSGGPSWW